MQTRTFKARRVVQTTFRTVFTLQGGPELLSHIRLSRANAEADAAELREAKDLGFEVIEVRATENVIAEPVNPWELEQLVELAGAIDLRIVPEFVD